MNNSLVQVFLGCAHRKTTFPLTPVRQGAAGAQTATELRGQTYVACLDCGSELPYNWESMRRIRNSRILGSVQAIRAAVFAFRLRSAGRGIGVTRFGKGQPLIAVHGSKDETKCGTLDHKCNAKAADRSGR